MSNHNRTLRQNDLLSTNHNTSPATHQTRLHQNSLYSMRPFDRSIAQLEHWPVKPLRTRRNGSTGLRKDINYCFNHISHFLALLSKQCIRIVNILDRTTHKIQLSTAHAPSVYRSGDNGTVRATPMANPAPIDHTVPPKPMKAMRPMQEPDQSNLLKDGLVVTMWIGFVPSVMLIGTMAGF